MHDPTTKKSFRCYASHSFIYSLCWYCCCYFGLCFWTFFYLYIIPNHQRGEGGGGRGEERVDHIFFGWVGLSCYNGRRRREGEVQRKREPNNWGIIRVGPLLPYAAGKAQVSHPLGILLWAHTCLGWYYFTSYLLCSWELIYDMGCFSFVCLCVFFFWFGLSWWFFDILCGFSFFLSCLRLVPCFVCVKSCLV